MKIKGSKKYNTVSYFRKKRFTGTLEYSDGDEHWEDIGDLVFFKNGEKHREDGPALIINSTNHEEYFLEGTFYLREEFKVILYNKAKNENKR
jgi:hypothetical protein